MVHYKSEDIMIRRTSIQTFYADQSIFITGATGFLGIVLLEKLLRSCPDISKMYVLIRPKKNKSSATRLNEILEISVFDRLKKEMPNFRDKIVSVTGDLSKENLGLAEDDIDILMRKTSIIFHLAAIVRFNENIKQATMTNLIPVRTILNMAKHMPNLKSFIHVSTTYTNCYMKHIKEEFYNYPIDPEELITLVQMSSESTINETVSSKITLWPNTYTCTKALAEKLVENNSENLPIGIFRPSILVNTAYEPIVGWVNNYYGPMGILVPISQGMAKFCHVGNVDYFVNLVPIDITVNALIASAWNVYNHPHRKGDNMLIYNCVSTNDAPVSLDSYYYHAGINARKYLIKNCYWLPTVTLVTNKIVYAICNWFCHMLPALLMDIYERFTGATPRAWKIYKRIKAYNKEVNYFMMTNWTFDDDNVQTMWQSMDRDDQLLFNFNLKGFDWQTFLEDHFIGIRLYLFNDNPSALTANYANLRKLYWIHQITKAIFMFVVLVFIQKLYTILFS